MPRRKNDSSKENSKRKSISLKELAAHLGLSPTSLSIVLNDAPAAAAIPQETKDRIFAAAEKFNYRPNYFARSLRAQRSYTFGVIVPELSDGYSAMVFNGVEAALASEGYFYLTTSHLHRDDLLKHNPQMLVERQVEGIIAVDTPIRFQTDLPVVSVSGHDEIKGVTNVVLNHRHAAELGVGHLFTLGHRRIAFIKGQDFSSDTEIRWETIMEAARKRGLKIDSKLTAQLEGDLPSPEIGYVAAKKILSGNKPFTALFAFNDISAMGAIHALQEAGLRVPEDVSVVGFDAIYFARFNNPAITTIRQPLFEMGKIAAQTLLKRLSQKNENGGEIPQKLTVEPELVVRDSTAPVCKNPFKSAK
ncbi:MAG: LacI family DNA-binding transcriptional regulator [Pyrinomonadaceae bacterium]